jgi:hypothetical protein
MENKYPLTELENELLVLLNNIQGAIETFNRHLKSVNRVIFVAVFLYLIIYFMENKYPT